MVTLLDALNEALREFPELYDACRELLYPGSSNSSSGVRSNQIDPPAPINLEAEAWQREIVEVVVQDAQLTREEMGIPLKLARRGSVAVKQDSEFLRGVAGWLVETHPDHARELTRLHRSMVRRVGRGPVSRRRKALACPVCAAALWQQEGTDNVVCDECPRSMTEEAYREYVLTTMEAK